MKKAIQLILIIYLGMGIMLMGSLIQRFTGINFEVGLFISFLICMPVLPYTRIQ